MICGSGGSKSRLAKAAGAEPSGQMRDEKHAVVARSTFANEKAKNTSRSDHLWKLRCRKSARRCGAKPISSHFQVKMHKAAPHFRTTFERSDVVFRGRRKGLCTLKWEKRKGFVAVSTTTTTSYIPLHATTCHYTTNTTATTLHYSTLHNTTLHYTTLRYTTQTTTTATTTLLYTTLDYTTLPYITLHYATLITPPQMQLQLHYTGYTTPQLQLHYTATTAALHHSTSSSGRWGDRPGDHCNHCNHSKQHNSSHLQVHQRIRSAIRDSQQPSSAIGFPFWNFRRHRLVRYYWNNS